jgi:hypothetical protein
MDVWDKYIIKDLEERLGIGEFYLPNSPHWQIRHLGFIKGND